MKVSGEIKGISMGNLFISTKAKMTDSRIIIEFEPKEVWDLFIQALREDKIKFKKGAGEKRNGRKR